MFIKNPDKNYYSDTNLVYSCQYHIIWCTKYRRKVLDEAIQKRLHHLICSKQTELDFKVRAIDIMEDHVHLILENNPKVPITRTIGLIKGYTSKMLREEFPHLKSRLPSLWTRSKFISSVGSVSLEVVKKYIEDQKHV